VTGSSEQVIVRPGIEAASPTNAAVKPTGAQLLAAFPPRPSAGSWPGTEATRAEVLARVLRLSE
jgi:hypothetical protein